MLQQQLNMRHNKFFRSTILAFPILLAAIVFTNCEKSILTDDPGELDTRNINLEIYHYWGSHLLNADSLYHINGARIQIQSLELLISDFVFDNSGDSIITYDKYTMTSVGNGPFKIGYLEPGAYSGYLHFKVGLDSLTNSTSPDMWSEGHFLSSESRYNELADSYNHIVIKGLMMDPSKPEATEPTIPISYTIATQPLVKQLTMPKSFTFSVSKKIQIDALLDVQGLFEGINPLQTPIILSDPTDQVDYDNAATMAVNFENHFQL